MSFRIVSPSVVVINNRKFDLEEVKVGGLKVVHDNILNAFTDDRKWKGLEGSLAILRQLDDFPVSSPKSDVDVFRSHLIYFCERWAKLSIDQTNVKEVNIETLGSGAGSDIDAQASVHVYPITNRHHIKVSTSGGVSIYPPLPSHRRTIDELRERLDDVSKRLRRCIDSRGVGTGDEEALEQLNKEKDAIEKEDADNNYESEPSLSAFRWGDGLP